MSQKKILICPLNWGIGHATRCVPIIRSLHSLGHEVLIAADKAPLAFLQAAFPGLTLIQFPGYEPQYSRGKSQIPSMLKAVPELIKTANQDNKHLEKIVKSHQIDAVISDNRFGAYSTQVPSIFITHQLHIHMPGMVKLFRPVVHGLNHKYIRRYSVCWVPDFENEPNLSGSLSHPAINKIPVNYIGPLSRFSNDGIATDLNTNYDVLAILSGPEPQRTLLEKKIIDAINALPIRVCILRGKPGDKSVPKQTDRLHVYNHADDEQILRLFRASDMVISRPGYSTIMDLVVLQKRAYFVPTPGQTEQEYLANRLKNNGWFNSGKQDQFDLRNVLHDMDAYHPPAMPDARQLLQNRLQNWLYTL